jgi:hypothetical protein
MYTLQEGQIMNDKQKQKYINQAEIFTGDISGHAVHEWYSGEYDDPVEALNSGALTLTDAEMHEIYCGALFMIVPKHHQDYIGEIATYWQKQYK